MLPPQGEEPKHVKIFRGQRNMRSLYYNTNEDNLEGFEDDSQQSKPHLPKNAHVTTGNGQYLL